MKIYLKLFLWCFLVLTSFNHIAAKETNAVQTQEIDLTIYQAICYRLLAQVSHTQGQYNLALTHLQQARKVFISQEMIIEMALSDLVEAEVKVVTGEIQSAEERFRRRYLSVGGQFGCGPGRRCHGAQY